VISGRVLDTPALVDWATQHTLYTQSLVWAASRENIVLVIPAAALAAAWASIPASACEVLNVLLGLPVTIIEPIDQPTARNLGDILNSDPSTGLDGAHAVHVAAARGGWPIVTSEDKAGRLLILDQCAEVELLP
jgi:hypothetical protein